MKLFSYFKSALKRNQHENEAPKATYFKGERADIDAVWEAFTF